MKTFDRRRWTAVLAVIAALTVSLACAGRASASQPGESNHWAPETVSNGQSLTTRNEIGEARQGNNILDVWRGETNNTVWLSLNHGVAFQLGSTATYVAPTVVPWGSSRFMIFHTGIDNRIYYTWYDPGANTWAGSWQAVPNQTTRDQVDVAQIGDGGTELYMVYRSSTDDRIWGTLFYNFDGAFPATGDWMFITNIDGGTSPSEPTVTYSAANDTLYAVVRGEDNRIYVNAADLDNDDVSLGVVPWGTWTIYGDDNDTTPDAPTIASTRDNSGNVVVAFRSNDSHIDYGIINVLEHTFTGFAQDITNWQTFAPIFLSVARQVVYMIVTGTNDVAYWKQAFNS